MTLDDFEALAQSQKPADGPWQPVTDYSEEARDVVEAPHANVLLETFRPWSVLDAGCGPGHLVRLINARVGHSLAAGADLEHVGADYVLDLTAPKPRIKPRELVICREVLEHLTILQVRKAVTTLCALSTRWVYVTTRFHPAPASLLDVATKDDLDPTHITMLSQDLLRLLFVLEGFRRRADLEAKMDHLQKGRVLVYERAS